jgi:hypothetical protein
MVGRPCRPAYASTAGRRRRRSSSGPLRPWPPRRTPGEVAKSGRPARSRLAARDVVVERPDEVAGGVGEVPSSAVWVCWSRWRCRPGSHHGGGPSSSIPMGASRSTCRRSYGRTSEARTGRISRPSFIRLPVPAGSSANQSVQLADPNRGTQVAPRSRRRRRGRGEAQRAGTSGAVGVGARRGVKRWTARPSMSISKALLADAGSGIAELRLAGRTHVAVDRRAARSSRRSPTGPRK